VIGDPGGRAVLKWRLDSAASRALDQRSNTQRI
jgi:hypothetical protein